MQRQIYTVTAIQIVTSESHPEGLKSTVQGYPKDFDSRNYNATEQNPNGNTDAALMAAKSDYHARLSAFETVNPNRVMATLTLEQADGRHIMRDCIGAMPDMTPAPVPEEPTEEVGE